MIPTLDPKSRLESVYEAILFTLIRLKLDPRLEAFVPVFEQLVANYWDVLKKERAILDEGMAADAAVDSADAALDGTSDGVAGIVLIDVKNNRRAAQFVRYFGTQRPSRFKRPILSGQLAAMRTWPPSLLASPNPTLKAYGEALVLQIDVADKAVAMVSTAAQKLADFRTSGEGKQLFDKVNGERKKLHGEAAKMVHDHPEWNLSSDYADALFQHEAAAHDLSIAEIEKKIEAAAAELARLTALRDERLKEAEVEAKEHEAAEKKAKQAEIDEVAQAIAEASARLAKLKAEIEPTDV